MMKNALFFSSLALSSALLNASPSFYETNQASLLRHHFSPVGFYKIHKEGDYNYEFTGVGIKYDHIKEKGLNFGTSLLSNLEADRIYVETESYLSVVFKTDFLYFSPKIMSKNTSHHVDKKENKDILIAKGTSYIGMGFSPNYDYPLKVTVEGFFFRDLYNSLLIQEGDKFKGFHFLNPFGVRGNLKLDLSALDNLMLNVECNYSRAIDKEYWEGGILVSTSWRF